MLAVGFVVEFVAFGVVRGASLLLPRFRVVENTDQVDVKQAIGVIAG